MENSYDLSNQTKEFHYKGKMTNVEHLLYVVCYV